MSGESSRARHSHGCHGRAKIVLTFCTGRALSASDPRVDQIGLAHGDAGHFGANRLDDSHRLMAQNDWKPDATISQHAFDAASHVKVALPDVNVGVAHAAVGQPESYFKRPGLRRFAHGELQWLAPFDNVLAFHSFLQFVRSVGVTLDAGGQWSLPGQ